MKKILIILCINFVFGVNFDELREMYLKDSKYWSKALVDDDIEYEEIGALPLIPPYPLYNPYSKSKVELGEKLFNDPRLSSSNQIACASCHDREFGFGDGRRLSYGHNRALGKRNSPSVAMSAFGIEKFWDGRAKNLEEQALMPILDEREMAFDPDSAAKKLNNIKEYKILFKEAFGSEIITKELIGQAIATYERSLMPQNSRFDRFMRGDSKALSDKEIWGLHIFRTKARCMNCHNGVSFSDQKYHNLGLTYYGRKYEDLGRYIVTKDINDIGAFKTPSLRLVSQTKPYMHNGLFPSLKGVLNAYNAGMFHPKPNESQKDDPLFPKTSPLLHKLNLTNEELDALEAFLKTL